MNGLEQALRSLGRELDVPLAPDVVSSVLGRIEPRASRQAAWAGSRRRVSLAVALVLLAALAATLAVPDARSALLRILNLGGEQIELVDELPAVEGALDETTLGEPVTLDEARRRVGLRLRELERRPDRVYLLGERPMAWFVYGPLDDVRLLVSQTPQLMVDRRLIAKKVVGRDSSLEETLVDGSPAFYLSGSPHVVLLLDERGNVIEDSIRLAGNVLLWQDDDIAFRLEGDFTLDEAVELGESLRPPSP
ncbi:MAG: hypothetical protein H0U46_05725 [Actinobacteria bacterium]|nr:hypothetical protein [Actinomycetota bacterium]